MTITAVRPVEPKNPGIVPPWLSRGNGNGGIVPPWMREPVMPLPGPVDEPFHILPYPFPDEA
jgi:hypothetical protein